jgi:hypothetical protein
MKLHAFFKSPKVACGALLAVGLVALTAHADEWDKKTVITIDQPMQISSTLLQPGSYTLRRMDSSSDRHIVQIWNGNQMHLINTVLTIPKIRAQATGHSTFTFWETPPGTAQALRAWFYPGDTTGDEFPYPKNPQMLAVATPPPAPVAVVPEPPPAPEPVPEATPAPEPQPAPEVEAPAPMTDQDQTPVPPPPEADRATPAPEAPPAELPKTASPYPLFGACGIALALFAGLLRVKRTA